MIVQAFRRPGRGHLLAGILGRLWDKSCRFFVTVLSGGHMMNRIEINYKL